jgi:phosphate transport system ATP-binding protein
LLSLNGLITEKSEAKLTGKIEVDGAKVQYEDLKKDKSLSTMLRENIGIVFQQPVPFPLSIQKNMEFALKFNGIVKSEREDVIKDCLEHVNLYNEVKNDMRKNAKKLSGGQQQRLCIARALTTKPKILLLDEPCSALDVKNVEIIEKLLLSLKEKYTIILVTHNIAQANRIADDVVFMLDGDIIESGTKMEVFTEPKDHRTGEYLNGNFG